MPTTSVVTFRSWTPPEWWRLCGNIAGEDYQLPNVSPASSPRLRSASHAPEHNNIRFDAQTIGIIVISTDVDAIVGTRAGPDD